VQILMVWLANMPTSPVPPLGRGVRLLLVLAFLVCSLRAVSAANPGRVVGAIVGASGKEVANVKVVLVQFKLDAEGVPQGAPIQTVETDSQGRFDFQQVPIDTQAVYKLGTRIAGGLVASEPFTFPDGKQEVRLDLAVPALVSNTAGLHFTQALVALEPAVGTVWVTEVLHVGNPTGNVIDVTNQPLELSVPDDAQDLTPIRIDLDGANHTLIGPKLLVYGRIEPGDSTIAFRYRVGAALGSLRMEKHWPHPVDELLVVAPQGTLKIVSEQLSPQAEQKFEGVPYDAWGAPSIAAQGNVVLKAQGIPLRQELLLIPLGFFCVVMAGIVLWFVRYRLPRMA
jgi:hypothetical protein